MSLIDEIILAIRNTPDKDHEYMCHGEPHCDSVRDYDALRDRIGRVLAAHGILPEESGVAVETDIKPLDEGEEHNLMRAADNAIAAAVAAHPPIAKNVRSHRTESSP